MTNSHSDWTQVLGHNFRTLAKAALGFYMYERRAALAGRAVGRGPDPEAPLR